MNWWPFGKKRRQSRYVLNVHKDLPLDDLIEILRLHTPVISAREHGKLPPILKGYFVRAGR